MLRPALSVSLYLEGKNVLLVDGDSVAGDRAKRLNAAGAVVRRIPPEQTDSIDFAGVFALFAHSPDVELNRTLASQARQNGVLAYAHDLPEVSDFAMPALVTRGPLAIAISTSAAAPALSRRFREELTKLVDDCGAELDSLIDELTQLRASLPKGKRGGLYDVAARLEIVGAIEIANQRGE